MEPYTEDQKVRNYQILLEAIESLENGRITEDWMEAQKRRIWLYRTWFHDLSTVNSHNCDPQYRTIANVSEGCLARLIEEIKNTGTFTPVIYLKFSLNVKFLAEYSLMTDELADIMNKLKI
jgi:hypothetical protein